MSLIIPNSFGSKTIVQLGDLDENFTYLKTNLDTTNNTISNLQLDSVGGTLSTSKGGTGLTSIGADGTVLSSNGTSLQYTYVPPPGTVMFFAANSAPSGWLKANGSAISRTAYANLFNVVGTLYGVGNGSTTFNLPDLRGEFIRGWDDSRGVDSGRGFGTWQNFDWKGLWLTNTGQNSSSGYSHNDVWLGKSTTEYTGRLFTGYWSNPSAHIGGKWGTEEPRPRNVALLACIKY